MKIRRTIWCLAVFCCMATLASGRIRRQQTENPGRIYRSVERLDTVSGEWERLNACARLTQGTSEIEVVIWNNWSDEKINPLVRVVFECDSESQRAGAGCWQFGGVLSRGLGSTERSCTVESCTIIAGMPNVVDLTIFTSDYSMRYRIGRKISRKL
ncbi:MAG: hypothetical protein K2G93_08375 [Rikenella sp.]|nr:hypothetical protein [Rikenella sp.]